MNIKNIGILIPNGWGIKAFLLNDFLEFLSSNANVFIFSTLSGKENFKNFFKRKNVFFEELKINEHKFFQRLFSDFLIYSQYFRKPTHLNQTYYKLYPAKGLKNKIIKNIKINLAKYFGKYISIDFQKFLEKNIFSYNNEIKRLKEIYSKNEISLIFSTLPLIHFFEHPALFAAKELNLKTSCMITSWDNFASKGRLPVKFDHYFCWSDLMKKELMEFYPFIQESQISVTGPPQFDYYFKKEFLLSKDEFFKKIGANLNKKLILWAAASQNQFPTEEQVIESFFKKMKNGAIKKESQLVLRAHPIGGLIRFKKLLENNKEIIPMETNSEDPKFLLKWVPTKEDIIDLVNILYYSDVIINHCSTMTLDACAFDNPVINISYDIEKNSKLEKYLKNCYKYDHYTCVLDFQAVKIANSEDELIEEINEYLEKAETDSEGRKKLLDLQIKYKDGKNSVRIAEKLLELV